MYLFFGLTYLAVFFYFSDCECLQFCRYKAADIAELFVFVLKGISDLIDDIFVFIDRYLRDIDPTPKHKVVHSCFQISDSAN